MTKQEIKQAISKYIDGQGNQAGLQGLSDILNALNNDTEAVALAEVPNITTISALQTVELTAEEATEAGFTEEVIKRLTQTIHPTIKFSDMVVTFNAYEEISHELAIWTGIIYDAPSDSVYHSALYLYADGRIMYNVDIMQH